MKNPYKSLNERLNHSRNHFKSLLNEQTVTCTGVDNNGTPISGNLNWCATWNNLPPNNPAPPLFTGTNAEFLDACSCPTTSGTTSTTTCDMTTFTNVMGPHIGQAPTQFVTQLTNNWMPMFHNKYVSHSDPCRFLNKRLEIQQDNLAQKQAAGINPQWQAMLTAKINAIEAVIAHCC